ncbi:MAG TPA: hypothetical protein VM557_09530 [Thermoanaerobaculia bacterium]|nr:hypothetical protein [Thermoanaerobaculia bacterium]
MELEERRDLARIFWLGEKTFCPTHPATEIKGHFVQSPATDYLVFDCPAGGETITIGQRPRQMEFNRPQVEGLILSLARGDSIRCYRCQAKLAMSSDVAPGREASRYQFTCTRCLSWGTLGEGEGEPADKAAVS